jgi:hypothetical protein
MIKQWAKRKQRKVEVDGPNGAKVTKRVWVHVGLRYLTPQRRQEIRNEQSQLIAALNTVDEEE